MENVSRRSFLGTIGVMGAAAAMGATEAQASPMEVEYLNAGDDAQHIAAGGTTLTLRQINARRAELVAAATEFTGPDGFVVPEVWAKAYTLYNTYGTGAEPDYGFIHQFMWVLKNDEKLAQAYIDMPWGVKFSALQMADESGRPYEECAELCDTIASTGMIHRSVEAGVPMYNQLAYAFGSLEAIWLKHLWDEEYLALPTMPYDTPFNQQLHNAGGPMLYNMVASNDVIDQTSEVLPLDDVHAFIDTQEIICIAPCQCQMPTAYAEFGNRALTQDEVSEYVLPNGTHLETCFAFGANAEFYQYLGVGRMITKEEAHELVDRCIIDEGLMPTSVRSAAHEIFCMCHASKCNLYGLVRSLDEETFASSVARKAYSRYDLKFDQEACIKCGMCAQRCAMTSVEMGEDGYPVTHAWCVSCGQCGITCPAKARTLVLKPVEDRLPLAQTGVDDNNDRAGFRIENGVL